MKKIVCLMALVFSFLSFSTFAQTEKGKFLLNGATRVMISHGGEKDKYVSSTEKYRNSDFCMSTAAGYGIIDNLFAGLFLDFETWMSRAKEDGNYDNKGIDLTIGPWVRYFIVDLDGFKPYAQAGVGFGVYNSWNRVHPDGDWSKYKESIFTYRAGVGGTYFINDFVGLDGFMGFNHESYKHKLDDDQDRADSENKYVYNEFVIDLGIVIMLGK